MTLSTNQASDVERDLLAFIEQHTKKSWAPDVDLFETGAVSSLFAMQLVVFLESRFAIDIAGVDLTIDNFRTVNTMTALVARLRGESGE
jgi:methoxymalonate biosynthesis acyl carrier protein